MIAKRIKTYLFLMSCLTYGGFSQNIDSLFQIAIENNDTDQVKKLLETGANPNMRFESDLEPTPIMYASAFADGKALSLLIKAGASINEVDVNGDHALNWATYYGHVSNMKVLIKSGANLKIESKHGDALDVAFRLWHADSVLDVFRGTELDLPVSEEIEEVISAIRNGKTNKVKSILKKGVDSNSKDGLGMSLLHHAVRANNSETINILMDSQADPNTLNRVGQTPLTIAARFGREEIVKQLILNGTDVNLAGDEYQLTPLIASAVNGNQAISEILLNSGANPNHRDIVNECTALHWSTFYGNNEVAKLLMDRGASYTQKCLEDRHTAYSLARAYKNTELIKYIEQKRVSENPLLGSWRIKTINYVYADTTYQVDVHQGSLIVGKARYSIMYNPSSRARVPFKNLSRPTEEETIAGFRSIVFNSGPYEIWDNVMLAVPDIAKVPGFEGGRQYYRFESGDADGEILLRMYDETYPSGQKPEWFGKVEVEFILMKE